MIPLIRVVLRILFRFQAFNTGALKTPGPVLLLPNHVSWLDWLFIGVLLDDDWKFVTSNTTAQLSWFHRKIMLGPRTFPVDTNSPYAVRAIAEYLEGGGRLVLFPEGRISNTGSLMKLFDGTGFLIRKCNPAMICCYLRGANRLRWVRHKGWTRWFPRVTAHFSDPFRGPALEHVAHTVARERLTAWLFDRLVQHQFETEMEHGPDSVLAAICETGTNLPGRVALEDVTGTALTYRRVLLGAELLSRRWLRHFGDERGERIGVLLPNVNGMPVSILSLWAAGKVPAILNYSSGSAVMRTCSELAGLRRVITSRAFVEKARLDLEPLRAAGIALHFLEDIRAEISTVERLVGLLRHRLRPAAGLDRLSPKPHESAVILFTSGSEGTPKGVELTNRNLLANIRQAMAAIDLTDQDRFFNALPLFHSFGLTGGTLFPLVRGCYTFLYPSPLHYRIVPSIIYNFSCTVLMGTNTFLNGYARKAHPYDFHSLRFLVAGAEKVQTATFDLWARKFGVRILEGYGATECSPVLSVNTRHAPQVGSAGKFLPGIEHRLEPVEGVENGGRLFVRGPNVMKGYLNPEANARFKALDGWYDTGDIASVDDEGFVRLLGRMKRFAKISGEMVSLTAVEDALAGAFPQYGLRCTTAVISRPDPEKGEALVAVTNEHRLQLAEIRAAVRGKGLPNLYAPRELRVVADIPRLGTGKVDHRGLAALLASQLQPAVATVEDEEEASEMDGASPV